MSSKVLVAVSKGLVKPPDFVRSNLMYEVITGSQAYGVAEDMSDIDIYGFCVPPKNMIFPHLAGEIPGFGRQHKRFDQWQQHHIKDGDVSYDFQVYSIIKYFQLCMECNPNMLDSLFVPLRCVTHSTNVGNIVRENRKLFLCKRVHYSYKGYAYSQMHKVKIKNPQGLADVEDFESSHKIPHYTVGEVDVELKVRKKEGNHPVNPMDEDGLKSLLVEELDQYRNLLSSCSKRAESVLEHGMDVKYLYHVVRLLDYAEQILVEGDVDLERNNAELKAIRRGEVPVEEVERRFAEKESYLEKVYHDSKLRNVPDEQAIKTLLIQCLEEHYGSISECVTVTGDNKAVSLGLELRSVLARFGV